MEMENGMENGKLLFSAKAGMSRKSVKVMIINKVTFKTMILCIVKIILINFSGYVTLTKFQQP